MTPKLEKFSPYCNNICKMSNQSNCDTYTMENLSIEELFLNNDNVRNKISKMYINELSLLQDQDTWLPI